MGDVRRVMEPPSPLSTERTRSASVGDCLDRLALSLVPPLPDAGTPTADRHAVSSLCRLLLRLLFPGCFTPAATDSSGRRAYVRTHLGALHDQLVELVEPCQGVDARALVVQLLDEVPLVKELLETDVDAAFHNDPAAPDRKTIAASYPAMLALGIQRFAHRLYRRGLYVLARMMTEYAHARTGIDIHPGATIGSSFFIDHGTGVVIGETTTIGHHCVLYHGVTLGAWNPAAKDDGCDLCRGPANKRHPDLESYVTVYPGATILGGHTRVGHHSVVGGNVWLTHSVEPYSVVTITPPQLNIRVRRRFVLQHNMNILIAQENHVETKTKAEDKTDVHSPDQS